MSSNLSTSRILELLGQLKSALESFAARAEALNADLRTRIARERHGFETASKEHTAAHATALEEAAAAYEAKRVVLEQAYAARKQRIARAYQNSKESGINRIEQHVGSRKYELQKRMLQAERERDAAYAACAARLQEMRAAVATERARLEALETQVRARFSGYSSLARKALMPSEPVHPDAEKLEEAILHDLQSALGKGETAAGRSRGIEVSLFRYLAIWIVLIVLPVGLAFWRQKSGGGPQISLAAGAAISGGLLVLTALGRFLAIRKLRPKAKVLSESLAAARAGLEGCSIRAEETYTSDVEIRRQEFIQFSQQADHELKSAVAASGQQRVACRMEADERAVRAGARNDRQHAAKLAALETRRNDALATLRQAAEARAKALRDGSDQRVAAMTGRADVEFRAVQEEWQRTVPPIFEVLSAASENAAHLFPAWDLMDAGRWTPPKQFSNAAQFGKLEADLGRLCGSLPKDKRLALPGPQQLLLPLCLTYPNEGSVILETGDAGSDEAKGALNNIILRLLANSPAGRVNFTIIDPVGLGQNFAGIMHMADYEEQIINSRIWTQSAQIEEKLAQLNEHMEKVIQMYLRNEYATIAEYNEQAGVIAEKYHFLVVADFPNGFTDTAARRLLSIAASGPRCGVYTLLHWDRRQTLAVDFPAADLRKAGVNLAWRGAEFGVVGRALEGTSITLDSPPSPEKATEFIHAIGVASKDSSRVEVPFEHVTPPDEQMWTLDTSSELRVAIGRTGATKLQYLAIGKGTRQHGLVAGKTGSGKSTLFHVIVTNLAMWCSPEQVEFYLVDFKKGVEFKCYATRRLPHARVVAIESDREFGLSVLQRVDDELRRRGDLFRKLGVQDIPGYKRAGGKEPMPRCLLLIDEFQEFFVEDDKVAQTASLLLDRIVRQGRAFGIHVLLGSQTLGGAYTVARTTLGQMVIRVALQCNEADAYLIFEDDNPAPRLLSRPGEAIYNDAAGAVEGNSPFQVVWLPDQTRDHYLDKVRQHADADKVRRPGPIVFEGNAPSDARENELLMELLSNPLVTAAPVPRIWLGAPNSIKGPTEAAFKKQSGNNLLIVGQREEAILAMFALGALSLSAQFPAGTAEIVLLDSSAPGTPERDYLERLMALKPRNVRLVRPPDLASTMSALAKRKEQLAAAGDDSAAPTFLLIHGLHRFSKLRFEDDFSFSSSSDSEPTPGAVLNSILTEGTRLGIHVIASSDTFNNVTRFMTRKALSEFEMRLVFQMSANDSASLTDSPKASTLGLHRALLFNAQEGWIETFRPYSLPDMQWLAEQTAGAMP